VVGGLPELDPVVEGDLPVAGVEEPVAGQFDVDLGGSYEGGWPVEVAGVGHHGAVG
jgi:hypothetical protein